MVINPGFPKSLHSLPAGGATPAVSWSALVAGIGE